MKTKSIYSLLLALLTLAACTAEGPDIKEMTASSFRVQLDQAKDPTYTMNASGEAVSIKVNADCTWQISQTGGQTGIFTINNGSGKSSGTCTIKGTTNTTIQQRQGIFTLTTEDGIQQQFTVNQSKGDVTLTVDLTELNFPSKAEEQTKYLRLSCNTNWEIKKSGDTDWFTLDKESGEEGEYTITVTTNDEQPVKEQRCVLSINAGGVSRTVNVTRDAMKVTFGITPTEVNVKAIGDEFTITVTSNIKWTVTDITGGFANIKGTNGAEGNGQVVIVCDPNKTTDERPGVVTIETDDGITKEKKTCTITQAAGTLPVVDTFEPVSDTRTTANITVATSSTTFAVTSLAIDYIEVAEEFTDEEQAEILADEARVTEIFTLIETPISMVATNPNTFTFNLKNLKSGQLYLVRLTAANEVGTTTKYKFFTTLAQPGKDDNTPPEEP